jgi:hypothetical protein
MILNHRCKILFKLLSKIKIYIGNFCPIAITVLKTVAKIKFEKISNKQEVKDLVASNWISTTCRGMAILKTCAYNNRYMP